MLRARCATIIARQESLVGERRASVLKVFLARLNTQMVESKLNHLAERKEVAAVKAEEIAESADAMWMKVRQLSTRRHCADGQAV